MNDADKQLIDDVAELLKAIALQGEARAEDISKACELYTRCVKQAPRRAQLTLAA